MARTFKYNGQTYQDPGAEYSVEEVKKHLSAIFPEVAQAVTETKTLEDGTEEITFVKRAGTKGSVEPDIYSGYVIVELMGHARIAGYLREIDVAGGRLLAVSVPETPNEPAFERHYGLGAIYAVTPVSEEEAKVAARWLNVPRIPPGLRGEDVNDREVNNVAEEGPWL